MNIKDNNHIEQLKSSMIYKMIDYEKPKVYEDEMLLEHIVNKNLISITAEHVAKHIKEVLINFGDYEEGFEDIEATEKVFKSSLIRNNIVYENDDLTSNMAELIKSMDNSENKYELNKEVKGLFDKTAIIDIYDVNNNIAYINTNRRMEDLLVLLSIDNLSIKILFLRSNGMSREGNSLLYEHNLFLVSVKKDKLLINAIEKEIMQRKKNIKKALKLIRSVKVNPKFSFLNLKDTAEILTFYNTLNKEEILQLRRLTMNLNAENAISNVLGSDFDLVVPFIEKIEPMDLMLQSLMNIDTYNNTNKSKMDRDLKRRMVQNRVFGRKTIKIPFTDYNLILKDFKYRYNELKKWIEEFFRIVESNVDTSIKTTCNTNGIHYKASLDLAEELSKLWFINKIYLFGSVAKGQEKEGSDIDIAYDIGFSKKNLTLTRLDTLNRMVLNIIEEYEEKYQDIIKSTKNLDIITGKPKAFNLLALPGQKKKDKIWYEKNHFFDDAILLLDRDSFTLKSKKSDVVIKYKDIDYVLFKTYEFNHYIFWNNGNSDTGFYDLGIAKFSLANLKYIGEIKFKKLENRYYRKLLLNIKDDVNNEYVDKIVKSAHYRENPFEMEINAIIRELALKGIRSVRVGQEEYI